ncbi:MAG: RsmE family RNA methyltransferase [Spirochaetaceae bacterium]|nr:RsmE family RNA methyltransferase [Spirochaetaceae bacterium]
MNVVLFDSDRRTQSMPASDPRARHLLEVLGCRPGMQFRAGVVNGESGLGTVVAVEPDRIRVALCWNAEPVAPPDITLIVGLPRPPSARKILYQGAALGCRAMHFVHTRLSDPNYARSKLWRDDEWRRHLLDGVQQSAATTMPEVTCGMALRAALGRAAPGCTAVALDPETGARRLGAACVRVPLVLAVGPERGWSAEDRATLARHRFAFCTLGTRILRVETACVAAMAIVQARLGEM